MKQNIFDKVIQALKQEKLHNCNIIVQPEAIHWPDPEQQRIDVIPVLQTGLNKNRYQEKRNCKHNKDGTTSKHN